MKTLVFGEKIVGQEYRARPAVYGLLINDTNQIGIIKTPRGNFLPGGGVENEESHSQCLEREFVEEIGYVIEVGNFIGEAILYGFSPISESYLKMVGYFYEVSFAGVKGEKVEEDHELVWLDVLTADQSMLLEHQAWAIRTFKALRLGGY